MRNLKKFLALVLAFVMAMSLMVTVNAASSDFTDSEDIDPKFAEAVEVLSSIGIFQGTEENGVLEFAPKASVTRAQMAAVVYRLATGDAKDEKAHLYKEYQSFSDVGGDDWFAGYVGFCADAEIISGYPDGSFKPGKAVTGYEALKMLLCAVGWGQNDEFEGSGWTIRVGSTATGEGLLKNVNNSSYSGTLNQTALREMLAEVTFQAALVPTVIYRYGTYEKTQSLVSSVLNPSLGEKFFGLDSYTGIIVGNQQTGEDYTKLSMSLSKNGIVNGVSYGYTTDPDLTDAAQVDSNDLNTDTLVLDFDTETGIDQYGHQVKIWFDNRSNKDSTASIKISADESVKFDTEFTNVYTVMDQVTRTAVVHANPSSIELNKASNGDELTVAAKGADFTVPGKIKVSDRFYKMSETTDANNDGVGDAYTAASNGDSQVVLLISNSAADKDGKNKLDVAVALSVTAETIKKVNAFADPQTADGDVTAGLTSKKVVSGWDNVVRDNKVVITGIAQTTGANATTITHYVVNKLTETKTGIVRAVNGKGVVTLDDGTVLEPSALYQAEETAGDNSVEADSVKGAKANLLIGNTLTFTKDAFGKYVGYQPAAGFYMYATYGYYKQTDIDKVTYYLQGVTMDGQIREVEISEADYVKVMDGTSLPIRFLRADPTASTGGQLTVDQSSKTYSLCYVNTNGTLSVIGDPSPDKHDSTVCTNGELLQYNSCDSKNDGVYTSADGVIMNLGDHNNTPVVFTAKTDRIGTNNYLSSETKYFEISGFGSTLKVTPYDSLTALLNGADSLSAHGIYVTNKLDTEHYNPLSKNAGVSAVLIDNATRISTTGFLYAGNANDEDTSTTQLTKTGETNEANNKDKASQFDLYTAGEDETHSVLVKNKADGDPADILINKFYLPVVKDADKDTGYVTLNAAPAEWTIYSATNTLAVRNQGTAAGWIHLDNNTDNSGDAVSIYAKDAKVIDLTDHGIDSYELLRRAVEENQGSTIMVDILLTEANGNTAAAVYVYSWT